MSMYPNRHRSGRAFALLAVTGLALAGCEETNKYYVTAEMFDHQGSDAGGEPGEGVDDGEIEVVRPYGIEFFEQSQLRGDIWSSLMAGEDEVLLVTLEGRRAVVYDVTDGPSGPGDPVVLLSNEPVPGFRVTDISATRMNGQIFLAASNPEATDIVLGAYSLDGHQLVAPRRVVEGSSSPTNDMKLVADGDTLVLSFGADGDRKHFMTFDAGLSVLAPDTTTHDPSWSSQLGCVVPTSHGYMRIAGNMTNHGLVGVHFDADWNASEADVFEVPIPAESDEWIWFSSGCVQDPKTDDWYVAFQHMWDGDVADDQSSVWIARFDADWTFLEEAELGGPEGFTRPQLELLGDTLYVSYDKLHEVWAGRTLLDPDRSAHGQ